LKWSCATLVAPCLLATALAADSWTWGLPPGMPEPFVPADNPMSEAKRALGQRLFFETKLSVTGGMACADCHEAARAFTDGRPRSPGATGELTDRGAMSLVNVAYSQSLGWIRPESRPLEAQMLEPLFNEHPLEMGLRGREQAVAALLQSRSDYRAQFRAAFPGEPLPVSIPNIIKAIACYERSLIFAGSPFDRYLYRGEHAALSPAAHRGMDLFFSTAVGCARCHSGINLAGPWRDASGATGPPALADNGLGAGRFKVPTLRNIALTAPYMHDGRFADLDAVLRHYGRSARHRGRDARLPARELTDTEQLNLRAFLTALTDPTVAR
jgi:cytochrome c peroxidase